MPSNFGRWITLCTTVKRHNVTFVDSDRSRRNGNTGCRNRDSWFSFLSPGSRWTSRAWRTSQIWQIIYRNIAPFTRGTRGSMFTYGAFWSHGPLGPFWPLLPLLPLGPRRHIFWFLAHICVLIICCICLDISSRILWWLFDDE